MDEILRKRSLSLRRCLCVPGGENGELAVVAARAVVVRDVAEGDIVGGNPAKVIGRRDS